MARRKREVIEQTIVELHQHDLGNYLQCPQKYYLSCVLGYVPFRMRKAINIGGLFAQCVYWMHKGTSLAECLVYVSKAQDEHLKLVTSAIQAEELETNIVIVQAMLQGYENHFLKNMESTITKFNSIGGIEGFDILKLNQIIPEYTISADHTIGSYTFRYINRLDGKIITESNPWILEIKTTTQFDHELLKKLNVNFQVNSYWSTLVKKEGVDVGGILYRYIKKPSIRQTKKETIEQYRKRLMMDYLERTDNYFLEECLYFNQPSLDLFNNDLEIHFKNLLMSTITGEFPRIGSNCDSNWGLCEYLSYCSNPTVDTLTTYFRKE
jgi:hypothetical protein